MSSEFKPDVNAADLVIETEESELTSRRKFLRSLGKWSAVIIGVAVGGSLLDAPQSAAWLNGGGGAWVNGRGGGGGSWVNRSGGGGAWVNRRGY